jgi:hypothetical protein
MPGHAVKTGIMQGKRDQGTEGRHGEDAELHSVEGVDQGRTHCRFEGMLFVTSEVGWLARDRVVLRGKN